MILRKSMVVLSKGTMQWPPNSLAQVPSIYILDYFTLGPKGSRIMVKERRKKRTILMQMIREMLTLLFTSFLDRNSVSRPSRFCGAGAQPGPMQQWFVICLLVFNIKTKRITILRICADDLIELPILHSVFLWLYLWMAHLLLYMQYSFVYILFVFVQLLAKCKLSNFVTSNNEGTENPSWFYLGFVEQKPDLTLVAKRYFVWQIQDGFYAFPTLTLNSTMRKHIMCLITTMGFVRKTQPGRYMW